MSAPDATESVTRISCDEALRIARADADAAYGDLTDYRIIVAFQTDGWHIDYELDDPTVKGGGPHYVIDARDGRILSKLYEQ